MTANKQKQTDTNVTLGGARSKKRSGVRPGYINFGSRIDPYNSLSARLRAEIDCRCFSRQDVETK